jgi:hypothetical protein
MKRFVFLLLCLVLGMTWVHAQDEVDLVVDAGRAIGPISPYVYGANFSPYSVVTVDLMDAAKVSGITLLRFPGGGWGDRNNIQHFQIDMFIKLCRDIGAEPSISVRLENGTPEAAAELVRYTNIEKGYNVRYWAIGNEPTLFDNYTVEDLNRDWRPIAEAMLAVDPNILLIGPEPNQFSGKPDTTDPSDAAAGDWIRGFLEANGDLVDIVAVHRYPFPKSQANPTITIDDLRQNAAEWSLILPALRAIIKEATGRDDMPVAITEANSSWATNSGGEATMDSLYNAIWWADVLGRLIEDQPVIVNYFDFQSSGERGGFGLLEKYDVRPTYYTYQLYKRFGTELVFSSSTDPDVGIYAATREDGALTLIVVNLGPDEVTKTLAIDNFEIGGPAEVWRLDKDHKADQLDAVDLSTGQITVPGQSVTLYILPAS